LSTAVKQTSLAIGRKSLFICLLSGLFFAPLLARAAEPASAPASTSSYSIEDFFKNPKFTKATLSPDGSSLALLLSDNQDRLMLAVMDLATLVPKVLVHYTDADINNYHWVNSNRLVYDLTDSKKGVGDTYVAPGLFAINKDGSQARQLVERSTAFVRSTSIAKIQPWNTFFSDVNHAENSDEIFVTQVTNPYTTGRHSYNLIRLNTVTAQATSINRPGEVGQWLIDKQGVPRVAMTFEKNLAAVHYKDSASDSWKKLIEFDSYTGAGFTPLFLAPDGTLLVTAQNGQDTRSVYRYDIEKKQMDTAPLVTLKGYDFSGSIIFSMKQNKLLGVQYETDAEGTFWLDPAMQKIQQKIDAALPATVNHISVAEKNATDVVLVQSFSDTDPGAWYLYHIKTETLDKLGAARPNIKAADMAYKDPVKYTARDGLSIPAYLTLPKGKNKNLPMVVLVHGGPYVRGVHWRWDQDAQFLASRGYAVLEPEFRGSTGYGSKHFKAGWKQWGLAMQDDIADGTRWAIAQGYADPKRICIAGASYGGYATLMGLIKDPDLYQCGINWVGVTDINLLYDVSWSDLNENWEKYGMPVLVADQEKDAAQIKATSPLLLAERIKQPLLLAYGGSDRRVPIVHGNKFYSAIKNSNPKVEWIEYTEEGHGWDLLKNKVDFWGRVEKFLDQNIGH
jgi:dipeptidyl aminopeptidase/acylaminoacyl peptidase